MNKIFLVLPIAAAFIIGISLSGVDAAFNDGSPKRWASKEIQAFTEISDQTDYDFTQGLKAKIKSLRDYLNDLRGDVNALENNVNALENNKIKRVGLADVDCVTIDTFPINWCPDGAKTQFFIRDSSLDIISQVKSVIVVQTQGSGATGCMVTFSNALSTFEKYFIMDCVTAPGNGDQLRYAIIGTN